jgi:hypothetical protein
MAMAKAQVRSVVGILALLVCGGAIALFVTQSHGRGEPVGVPSGQPAHEPVAPEQPAAAPEPPVKLSTVGIPSVREDFSRAGYSFEDKPLPSNLPRVIGTSEDQQTVLEFVGPEALEQATLRYKLRGGDLNGQDLNAIMYLMEKLKIAEPDLRWATDAARKGEPATRTIGAVAYAVQRGPSGTSEFVMRPAPGFE